MRPKRYPYSGKSKASTTDIVKAWEKAYSAISLSVLAAFSVASLSTCMSLSVSNFSMISKKAPLERQFH